MLSDVHERSKVVQGIQDDAEASQVRSFQMGKGRKSCKETISGLSFCLLVFLCFLQREDQIMQFLLLQKAFQSIRSQS